MDFGLRRTSDASRSSSSQSTQAPSTEAELPGPLKRRKTGLVRTCTKQRSSALFPVSGSLLRTRFSQASKVLERRKACLRPTLKKPKQLQQSQTSLKQHPSFARCAKRSSYYAKDLEATQEALKSFKGLSADSQSDLRSRLVWLAPQPELKKVVVFDLDETLVHCCDPGECADDQVTVTFPDGVQRSIGINVRPFARQVLAEAKEYFEVGVFTASEQYYADAVLDFLDPSGQLFDWRLYRSHCATMAGLLVKDLRVLGNRRLNNVVLVDNLPQSYLFQLSNGVPVRSWYNDPADTELSELIAYLKLLLTIDDVRVMNSATFRLEAVFAK